MALQRLRWQADDADTARAALDELYGPVRWTAGASDAFRFSQDVHVAEGASFLHLHIGTSIDHASAESDEFMGVAVINSGRYRIRSAGMVGGGEHALLFPRGHLEASYSDLDESIVNFSMEYITRLIAVQTGVDSPGLDVRGLEPVSASAERDLRNAITQAFRSLDDPNGALRHELVRVASLRTLAMLMLHTFPIAWTARPGAARDDGATTATIRRALTYIDEHSTEPITTTDIAVAARLSVRGLHSAFRRSTGQTPMNYLRRVRLDNARTALQNADPTRGDTVSEIARTAGFGHMSRFAAEYREAFKETPRTTLRT